MRDPIIATELPQHLIDDVVYGTNNDNAKSLENARQSFIEAQRAAILRFCEAVEKEAKAIHNFRPEDYIGKAFKRLRDELKEPATRRQRNARIGASAHGSD